MATEEPLDKLRRYLVGKTIVAVDPPEASEAICRITTNDGKVWRLHATELGFWIEDVLMPGMKADNLTTLLQEYYQHRHYESPVEYEPTVTIEGDVLVVVAFDGRRYEAFIPALNEWEQKIVKHPDGPKLISQAAGLGDYWTSVFREGIEGCPPELYYPKEGSA